MQHPEEGYALISSEAPDTLAPFDTEPWLGSLKKRAAAYWATSRANLAALWVCGGVSIPTPIIVAFRR